MTRRIITCALTHLNIPQLIFPAVNITGMIISNHITTTINYRMAIPVGSEFLAYNNFPEVYHGEGISKAAMFASARRIAGQGRDTICSTMAAYTVVHLVFLRRSTPEVRKKIRNSGFSDLKRNERGQTLL